eukprot:3317333-Rhodomonas_salina.1
MPQFGTASSKHASVDKGGRASKRVEGSRRGRVALTREGGRASKGVEGSRRERVASTRRGWKGRRREGGMRCGGRGGEE